MDIDLSALFTRIVQPILIVLAPVVAGFVVALLRQQLAKINVQLRAEAQAELEKLLEDIILGVNEQAHRTAKLTSGKSIGAVTKQTMALAAAQDSPRIIALMHQLKTPDLHDRIDQRLGALRSVGRA